MKIIFLDFDGVMDTAYYDHVLAKEGKPGNDEYGIIFDTNFENTPVKGEVKIEKVGEVANLSDNGYILAYLI